ASHCGTGASAGTAACNAPQVCYADSWCSGSAAGRCALLGPGPVSSCRCGVAGMTCPANYACSAGRCVYSLPCDTAGSEILVDPAGAAPPTPLTAYLDGVEDFRNNGSGAPMNPELRASGPGSLAAAIRSGTDWYNAIVAANSDPHLFCRHYALVLLVDG